MDNMKHLIRTMPLLLLISMLGCGKPPACEEPAFTTSIVDVDKLDYIIPLGNLNPPGHTLPTRHMYFWVTEPTDLLAPARIRVTNLHIFTGKGDYEIGFEACDGINGYFIHLDTLSPRLEPRISFDDCAGDLCFVDLDVWFDEGEFLGQVGINGLSFDLGIIDDRVQNEFVSQQRYGDYLVHAACGLDYFSEEIESQYYSKLSRTGEPRCGTIAQDAPGTLQGNWFYTQGSAAYSSQTYNQELAFVHHAENTSRGVISIGGTLIDANTWHFDPRHEGLIDREPSEVVPGAIYCYGREGWDNERIIVEMLDTMTIRIEYQEKHCGEAFIFQNPMTYYR
jgi:hypothetical protein